MKLGHGVVQLVGQEMMLSSLSALLGEGTNLFQKWNTQFFLLCTSQKLSPEQVTFPRASLGAGYMLNVGSLVHAFEGVVVPFAWPSYTWGSNILNLSRMRFGRGWTPCRSSGRQLQKKKKPNAWISSFTIFTTTLIIAFIRRICWNPQFHAFWHNKLLSLFLQ